MKWVPVSNRQPKKYVECFLRWRLVSTNKISGMAVGCIGFDGDWNIDWSDEAIISEDITYWLDEN